MTQYLWQPRTFNFFEKLFKSLKIFILIFIQLIPNPMAERLVQYFWPRMPTQSIGAIFHFSMLTLPVWSSCWAGNIQGFFLCWGVLRMANSLPKKVRVELCDSMFWGLTPTFTFLVGNLPSSTLRTFWGGTSQKIHPCVKQLVMKQACKPWSYASSKLRLTHKPSHRGEV